MLDLKTSCTVKMTDAIVEQLPKIRVALEEIALGLNYLRKLDNKETKVTSKLRKKIGSSMISSIGHRGEE
jgi:hypothetical protein